MDDQLTNDQEVRVQALALAVEYTKAQTVYSGNSFVDGTVLVAKRYAKYIEEGT